MKCTCILLFLLLKLHMGNCEKFIAVLLNHNGKNLGNITSIKSQNNVNIKTNLNNILRATICNKKPNKCGRGIKSKIVGGFQVDNISSYPYHVKYGSSCAGAIIDQRWVITAGHCGHKDYILAGSKFLEDGTRFEVEDTFIHPIWLSNRKAHFFDYDYQLVKLEKKLIFNANIHPIKIAKKSDLQVGNVVTVTGWGHTRVDGERAQVLQAVQVPIVNKSDCQKVKFPMYKNTLTKRMFCAGYFEGEKDACQGDSGGAAVTNGRLIGLVSFGYGCATPESYGVYSNVLEAIPWMKNITGLDFS